MIMVVIGEGFLDKEDKTKLFQNMEIDQGVKCDCFFWNLQSAVFDVLMLSGWHASLCFFLSD